VAVTALMAAPLRETGGRGVPDVGLGEGPVLREWAPLGDTCVCKQGVAWQCRSPLSRSQVLCSCVHYIPLHASCHWCTSMYRIGW
jgi:hypothetical protein